jgi:hypothetical protein
MQFRRSGFAPTIPIGLSAWPYPLRGSSGYRKATSAGFDAPPADFGRIGSQSSGQDDPVFGDERLRNFLLDVIEAGQRGGITPLLRRT